MQTFRVALIQQRSIVCRKRENLQDALAWTERAHREGADLVCFPELNITGHAGTPEMLKEAEPVPDGPSVQALCEAARDMDLHVCAGIAEYDRGLYYNTQFLIGPHGFIGKQRKTHLSHDEYYYFRAGTRFPVFELPFARAGIIICYDNLLPEISRCMAVQGAELLLCPHAGRFGKWPADPQGRLDAVRGQKDSWRMVHACRAYDNGCYVALCNAVGSAVPESMGVDANHAGACMVFNPFGEMIAESQSIDIEEEMLVVDLIGEVFASRRRNTCFSLATRRPELFGVLVQQTD